MIDLKCSKIGIITLLLFGFILGSAGSVYADPGVNATPEVQGLSTATTADVVGLVTESDVGTWTLTNDPLVLNTLTNETLGEGFVLNDFPVGLVNLWQAQLQAAGGSIEGFIDGEGNFQPTKYNIPTSLMNTPVPGLFIPWSEFTEEIVGNLTARGIHDGVIDPGQVQVHNGIRCEYCSPGRAYFIR